MKILMVTNVVAPDKLGGLERYVRELAATLVRKGHDVTTLSKRTGLEQPSAQTGDDGVRLLRFSTPPKSDPLFVAKYPVSVARSVRRTILGADYDVLHGHYPISMLPVLTTRIPYLYTFHAPVHKEVVGERQGEYPAPGPVSDATVRVMKAIERRVLERATTVVTLSDFVGAEMRTITRPGSTNWKKIPGGLQTDYFTPRAGVRPPIDVGRPLIVTARRLVERTLRSRLGSPIERWEMARKVKKLGERSNGHAEAAFGPDWCKGHFGDHGQLTLTRYEDRIRAL